MTDYERIKREYDLSLLQKGKLMSKVWPIGSIYLCLDETDPSVRFGGQWVRIEGSFLLAASKKHPAGETGGAETHTLTEAEMPAHVHAQADMTWGYDWLDGVGQWSASSSTHDTQSYTTKSAGGGQAHNNMPPYLSVYIWQRVA